MMSVWLPFIAALAGFGLLSLTMQRHAHAWPVASHWRGGRRRVLLALGGSAALLGSAALSLHDNPQLGAVYWSAYAMAAVLIVTGLHAYAERWAVRMMLLVTAVLVGSVLAAGLSAVVA